MPDRARPEADQSLACVTVMDEYRRDQAGGGVVPSSKVVA